MDALILSCSTGGGHNAAGFAVKEELERRGHQVTMLDPYTLAGDSLGKLVGNGYIKTAQKAPHFFGFLYKLGDGYRKLPVHSPVYAVNKAMFGTMRAYFQNHHFDVVIMPHLFPAQMLTHMKRKGVALPPQIFIATDYVCIPFTEETDCDYYVIPGSDMAKDFIRRGIPSDKLVPAGIPVRRAFREPLSREEAKRRLGLEADKHYILLSGGSIGCGQIEKAVGKLSRYLKKHPQHHLIVICGNNQALLTRLEKKFGKQGQISLLASTNKMAAYLRACDVYLSKPGGLSSTEAAVMGIPLIHIAPIPGCEIRNMEYFAQRGMSLAVDTHWSQLEDALVQLAQPISAKTMQVRQRQYSNPRATEEICDLAEKAANIETSPGQG